IPRPGEIKEVILSKATRCVKPGKGLFHSGDRKHGSTKLCRKAAKAKEKYFFQFFLFGKNLTYHRT
ncbi:MAG TPA: hypothetical protein VJ882_07170, partial [Desulfuromonadales bacterium]|nr:hypothetical protein [Desulfuromonadales bacterium]